MPKVTFISIRMLGQNFSKPMPVSKVLEEYKIDDLLLMSHSDDIRFFNEDGDGIEVGDAIMQLREYKAYSAFDACTTKSDFETFIVEYAESDLVKEARDKVIEILYKEAKTEDEFRTFVMRFPNSKFASEVKKKLPDGDKKSILVASSMNTLGVNDQIMATLASLNQTKVLSTILDKGDLSKMEAKVQNSDLIVLVVDSLHIVEVFVLLAICVKFKKRVVSIYPTPSDMVSLPTESYNNLLIKAQSSTTEEQIGSVIRHVRLNLEGYITKLKSATTLGTNQLGDLANLV